MGPKKTPDSTPKTITSFMEVKQPKWSEKMEEGIGKWLNKLKQSIGFINEQFELVKTKIKDIEEIVKENYYVLSLHY